MNAWPFEDDAVRDDPLTARRIAVVNSSHPMWCYIVAYLDVDPGPYKVGSAERPTEHEAVQLASFLEQYKTYWYNPGYLKKMEEKALDVDGGANGIVFIKYGPDDWGYRRRTWQYGLLFVPQSPAIRERYPDEDHAGAPLSLEALMDRTHSLAGSVSQCWQQWKADHPDIFTPAEETTP